MYFTLAFMLHIKRLKVHQALSFHLIISTPLTLLPVLMQSDGILLHLKTSLFLVDKAMKNNTQLFILDHYHTHLLRVLPRIQQFSLIISAMIYHTCTICTWGKTHRSNPLAPSHQKLLGTTAAAKFMWIFTFIPSPCYKTLIQHYSQTSFGLIFSDLLGNVCIFATFSLHSLHVAKHVAESQNHQLGRDIQDHRVQAMP